MYAGFAIYNTDTLTPIQAYALGDSFFAGIRTNITGSGYYQYLLKKGDHPGDHTIVETSFADLKKKILANQASAFRLYCQNKTAKPWLASFGYSTNTFGSGFFHVDAQYPDTGTHFEELIALIKELDRLACFSYGIAYSASEVTDAFYYATGNNFVNIFPYENSSAWKRELPGLYNGQARYQNSMLRMVYPINIINDHHLDIDVAGSTLREWIESNAIHGSLEKLNRMWLWKVDMNNLDHVNQCCGEAGVLISWRKPVAKTAIRKLP